MFGNRRHLPQSYRFMTAGRRYFHLTGAPVTSIPPNREIPSRSA
jgi:hypothetical protein